MTASKVGRITPVSMELLQLATGFTTCDEFQAKNLPREVIVDKLYRSILGREGQDDEKSVCCDRFARGDSIRMVINDCVESAEYREKAHAGTVPSPSMSVRFLTVL
jgi:hypothetical protein